MDYEEDIYQDYLLSNTTSTNLTKNNLNVFKSPTIKNQKKSENIFKLSVNSNQIPKSCTKM